MNSFSETQAAMKRPTLMTRTSSQGSVSRGSPGGTTGKTRQHRASTSRLHGRTPSYGKNLHKLTKIVSGNVEDGTLDTTKKKVNSPTSPLVATMVRRNTSAISLSKNTAKVPVRKNKSEVSLLRNTSSTQLHGKKVIPPIRRNGSHGKSLDKTKQHKNTIKFEVEDDEGEWTEESTSPVLTRQSSLSLRSRTQSRLNTPPGVRAEEQETIPHPSSIDPNKIEADGTERIVPGSPPDLRYDMAMLEELARTQERLRRNDKTNHVQIMSGNTLLDNNSSPSREYPSPLRLNSLLTPQPNGASRFLRSHQTLIPSAGSSFTRPTLTLEELRSESPDSQLLNEDLHRSASVGNLHKRPLVYFKDSREGAKIDSHTIISNGTIRAGAATQTKLELWRSQGNVEPIDGPPAPLLRGAPIDMLTNEERKTRLWENAEKELFAIRRFSNPILESAKRASSKDKARPDKTKLHVVMDNGGLKSNESAVTNGGAKPTTPDPRTTAVSAASAKRAQEGPRPPSRAGGRSVRFEVGASPDDGKDRGDPDSVDQILRRLWSSIEVANVIEG